jgi:predicted RNA-binding Zn-ribbon protein involved in translation (DUF1610 family)
MARIRDDEPCPCASNLNFGDCHGARVRNRAPGITARLKLAVISPPDPNTRSVFEKSTSGSVILQGEATSLSMDCGNCSASLIVGMHRDQVRGIVLRCNECGSYNDT